jgi:NAD/NADP transhydrogenase beta subunit
MPHEATLIKFFYLVASVLFIVGIKDLAHPRTAVRGNLLSALGMLIAIVVTLTDHRIVSYTTIIAGIVVGSLIGAAMAYRAPMTAMPQVVAIFNGFGGLASALAVGAALEEAMRGEWIEEITVQFTVSAAVAALIGAVAFTGSMVAFAKLQGLMEEKPVLLPARHAINLGLAVLCVLLTVWIGIDSATNFHTDAGIAELEKERVSAELHAAFKQNGMPLSDNVEVHPKAFVAAVQEEKDPVTGNPRIVTAETGRWVILDKDSQRNYTVRLEDGRLYVNDSVSTLPFWLLVILSSALGVLLVIPIGGADMPVVISLLNAYSGLAAAGHGWVLNNSVLIISGSLVGAAGFILTAIMSKAMNRSLANVMFAGVGAQVSTAQESDEVYAGRVKSASPDEVAMLMEGARRVVVVPGYGMAVAQAQYAIHDLTKLLESKGVEVEFAIHPVAGRMPGHMNVLLADANIPYDQLKEMDVINPTFKQTDVVLVIGANDVVNPMARQSDPSVPIAGMPILDVDQARTVVIIKRSLSPGFAGIPNPLFAADNALMLYGDAKKMVMDLIAAVKGM